MIALYCRVSTIEQAQNGHSIDEQQDRLISYCKARGWSDYEFFVDAGFSGAKLNRPALSNALKSIRNKKVDKILVYKLDRLSRSQKDTLMLIEDVFLANGCDFISISENFDTSTPLGRAMIGILAVFAQLEREQIKERMAMGHQARAKKGNYKGGWRNPIGYDYIDKQLVVNEFEKMQVVKIYEMYSQGVTPLKIAECLNNAGLNHKYGKWYTQTIRRIILSRNYLGEMLYQGEWYKGNHEPIISEELWDKCNTLLHEKHEKFASYTKRCGKASTYLGGFLVCGRCGARYSKKDNRSRGHRYPLYQCQSRSRKHTPQCKDPNCVNKNWKIDELNSIVLGEIRKLALEPIENIAKPEDTTPLAKQIYKLEKQQDKLIELYSMDSIPKDTLQSKIEAINEQIEKLNAEIDQIEENNSKISQTDVVSIASSLDSVLANGDLAEIRAVIGSLINYIELDGEDVTIHWSF